MMRDCDTRCAPGACPEYPCAELIGSPEPFFVYVAGRLSGDPGEYLANVCELSSVSRELVEARFCPINPAGDLLEGLMRPEALSVRTYQARSRDLLKLCAFAIRAGAGAAIFVVSDTHRDGRPSGGVRREIELSHELGIPIVRSWSGLYALRASLAECQGAASRG